MATLLKKEETSSVVHTSDAEMPDASKYGEVSRRVEADVSVLREGIRNPRILFSVIALMGLGLGAFLMRKKAPTSHAQ